MYDGIYILLFVRFLFALWMAYALKTRRQIRFGWAFLICMVFGVVLGWILIAIFRPKRINV